MEKIVVKVEGDKKRRAEEEAGEDGKRKEEIIDLE